LFFGFVLDIEFRSGFFSMLFGRSIQIAPPTLVNMKSGTMTSRIEIVWRSSVISFGIDELDAEECRDLFKRNFNINYCQVAIGLELWSAKLAELVNNFVRLESTC